MDRARRDARALRASHSGAMAVEFAFLAPIITTMAMSTLVVAYVYLAKTELNRITSDIGRQIQLGNAANMSQTDIQNAVCADIVVILNCAQMSFYIQGAPLFSSGVCQPISAHTASIGMTNGVVTTFQNYTVGGSKSVNIVQITYPLPIFGSRFLNWGKLSNGSMLISSTVVVYTQ